MDPWSDQLQSFLCYVCCNANLIHTQTHTHRHTHTPPGQAPVELKIPGQQLQSAVNERKEKKI